MTVTSTIIVDGDDTPCTIEYSLPRKSLEQIQLELTESNQLHLLEYYDELSEWEKDHLLLQLSQFDFNHLNTIFKNSTTTTTTVTTIDTEECNTIQPPPKSCIDSLHHLQQQSHTRVQELYNDGLELIAKNQVAILLLAGGQGTRLGSKLPKGMYDMQLQSHKSLFQLQSERIVKLQQLAKDYKNEKMNTMNHEEEERRIQIPYYILTNPQNCEETRQFFEKHNYFGLMQEQVHFFNQDFLPCFNIENGKLLMDKKYSICLAPNGNGGVYQALEHHGLLTDMEKRGVLHIHSYSIDNVLVRPADPIFMSFCAQRGVDFGTKVVPKREAHERVGVFALKRNRFHVVEYSEISKEMAERVDTETGELVFNAANIVNFYYSYSFLKHCAQIAKTHRIYHVAKKAIPVWNNQSNTTEEPKQVNGIKMELFNFDICEFADKVAILQVDREWEFSPLKNAPNEGLSDSPETCRSDLTRVCKAYIEKAGGSFKQPPASQDQNMVELLCEISPLLSYAGEGLEPIVKGKEFTLPLYLH